MPYPIIPALLGTSFILVWAFIGGMILRDGQLAARRQRELDSHYRLDSHPKRRIEKRRMARVA